MHSSRTWITVLAVLLAVATGNITGNITAAESAAKARLQSIGPLAFGPDGVLFAADSRQAAIFAIATGDTKEASEGGKGPAVENVDQKIAALLGTVADGIQIEDVVVNPLSGTSYVAVSRGRGPEATPVLVTVSPQGKLSIFDLEKATLSKAELPNPPAPDAVDRRKRPLRPQAITDLAFNDGKVIVAGLSSEEFSSNLRTIRYPFDKFDTGSSVEIYHGAHGGFETHAPVRTFIPINISGKPHVLAAYTCTPLVKFPIDGIQAGTQIKGTTIAELGNRNRPLDMISYAKDGKDFVLLANSSRGIMKLATDSFATAEKIETRVPRGEKAGVGYETIADWTDVHQLDLFDDEHALVLQKTKSGFDLATRKLP